MCVFFFFFKYLSEDMIMIMITLKSLNVPRVVGMELGHDTEFQMIKKVMLQSFPAENFDLILLPS